MLHFLGLLMFDGSMTFTGLIQAIYGLLISASTWMALGCFVAAALAWRSGGGMSFELGGRFTQMILWGFVWLGINSLPLILGHFNVTIGKSMPTSTSVTWLLPLVNGVQYFVQTWLVGYIVPVAAAALVVKALLDSAAGENPVPSLISALLALSVYPLYSFAKGAVDANGAEFSIPCGMMQLVAWVGNVVCPIIGSMCVIAAIINYVRNKPWGQLAITSIAMICFSGIWLLFKRWEGVGVVCGSF